MTDKERIEKETEDLVTLLQLRYRQIDQIRRQIGANYVTLKTLSNGPLGNTITRTDTFGNRLGIDGGDSK